MEGNTPGFSHGIGELADLINFQVGTWHDFGYETPPAPECKPAPPLGERSAGAIRAGHEAVRAIDELTRQLCRLRSQLVGELRQDSDLRAARTGAMPARAEYDVMRGGERSTANWATGAVAAPVVPAGPLPWALSEDGSKWRAELPDGRTAVLERVLGADGLGSSFFLPTVHESAGDFVTGPVCHGVLEAANWAAEFSGRLR